MSFEVGNQVKLKTTSFYYRGQKHYGIGRITVDQQALGDYMGNRYEIKFKCGKVRLFNDEDLILAYDINDKINGKRS